MGARSRGKWTPEEAAYHIHYLEMLAAYFSLNAFITVIFKKPVELMIDNTVAVPCTNKTVTCHSRVINNLVKDIWKLCFENNVWVPTVHIPGKLNAIADLQSRIKHRHTEWSHNTQIFYQAIVFFYFSPSIDLFASRLNCKV